MCKGASAWLGMWHSLSFICFAITVKHMTLPKNKSTANNTLPYLSAVEDRQTETSAPVAGTLVLFYGF